MPTRAQIVAEARRYVGTKWLHQGRVQGVGVDCIGLVYETARSLDMVGGIELPVYDRRATDNMMVTLSEQYLIRRTEPAIGCVVTMRFEVETRHMGILGNYPFGGYTLIHSYAAARKAVEHRLDSVWQSRITGYYDFPDIIE